MKRWLLILTAVAAMSLWSSGTALAGRDDHREHPRYQQRDRGGDRQHGQWWRGRGDGWAFSLHLGNVGVQYGRYPYYYRGQTWQPYRYYGYYQPYRGYYSYPRYYYYSTPYYYRGSYSWPYGSYYYYQPGYYYHFGW